MTMPNKFVAALTASLAPRPLSLAIDVVEIFVTQPNLPDWLLSLDGLSRDERAELLRSAAHVLRTELPDRICATMLERFAADADLLESVIAALRVRGDQSSAKRALEPVREPNTVQLFSGSAEGGSVAAP
jgi:hypothetical protein